MNINLLTRVQIDKNFFMDFVLACYMLKNKGYIINVKFIGKVSGIYSQIIVNTVERAIILLEMDNQIIFTREPMKISEIHKKDEYYFNLSVADFVGYSSIESIDNGLKTLFYNIDNNFQNVDLGKFICINSFPTLCDKLEKIYTNREKYDEIIKIENKEFASNFYLSDQDKNILKKIF